MLDSQQKRKINQILYHRATLVVLFILVLIVLRSTWLVYQKKRESEELRQISERYKSGLEERDRQLNSEMERLKTEPGKEAEIRSKFSVAKDNEAIVVIVDNEATTSTATEGKSWWEKFIQLFK
jgi:hypothetical protein